MLQPEEMDSVNINNNNSSIEEDELIIKDDIDNDCFEEVDRIGEIEKEVRAHLTRNLTFLNVSYNSRMR